MRNPVAFDVEPSPLVHCDIRKIRVGSLVRLKKNQNNEFAQNGYWEKAELLVEEINKPGPSLYSVSLKLLKTTNPNIQSYLNGTIKIGEIPLDCSSNWCFELINTDWDL